MTNILDDIFGPVAPPPPVLLDRSPLERYATCPFHGHACETGKVMTEAEPAASGIEAHKALAAVVDAFVRGDPEMVEAGMVGAQQSRPDVQPDVLAAVRPGLWRLAQALKHIEIGDPPCVLRNPADVLRYQGGQGDRTGQVAWDLFPAAGQRPATRLTSEIDVLLATPAADEMEEWDFKTGHANWAAGDIRASFQFPFHAWLAFKNYPGLNRLWVRVYMSRFGSFTGAACFSRRDLSDIEARLVGAVRAREDAAKAVAAGKQPETWPWPSKCEICDAARLCPRLAGQWKMMDDPGAFVTGLALREQQVEADTKALVNLCQSTGKTFEGDGFAFGRKPPAKETKASFGFLARK